MRAGKDFRATMVPLDFDLTLLRGAVVPARVGIVYKEVIFEFKQQVSDNLA